MQLGAMFDQVSETLGGSKLAKQFPQLRAKVFAKVDGSGEVYEASVNLDLIPYDVPIHPRFMTDEEVAQQVARKSPPGSV